MGEGKLTCRFKSAMWAAQGRYTLVLQWAAGLIRSSHSVIDAVLPAFIMLRWSQVFQSGAFLTGPNQPSNRNVMPGAARSTRDAPRRFVHTLFPIPIPLLRCIVLLSKPATRHCQSITPCQARERLLFSNEPARIFRRAKY